MTLDEQQAICDAATAGPWSVCPMEMYMFGPNGEMVADAAEVSGETLRIRGYGARLPMQENGAFIATARTEWPKLIEEHRKALAEIERLCEQVATLTTHLVAAGEPGAATILKQAEQIERLRAAGKVLAESMRTNWACEVDPAEAFDVAMAKVRRRVEAMEARNALE